MAGRSFPRRSLIVHGCRASPFFPRGRHLHIGALSGRHAVEVRLGVSHGRDLCVGWVHGVLFVGLWLLFLLVAGMRKIPVLLALLGMIAAIFPFGPFLIDGRLRKYDTLELPESPNELPDL